MWEYLTVTLSAYADITSVLNTYGLDKWELTSVTYDNTNGGYTAFLKRVKV